ncbi:MAG: hypothetical protein IAF00_09245, partial [Phycisphaerales bacterium]|nr:hypothetical protein [Phycisphaerales bacterium]
MDWVFLGILAVLWLISPIFLLIVLAVSRHQLQEARQQLVNRPAAAPSIPIAVHSSSSLSPKIGDDRFMAAAELENLWLLWLELRRLHQAGDLAEARWQQFSDALDQVLARQLQEAGSVPDNVLWQRRRAEAWNRLAQALDTPLGPPPWQAVTPVPASITAESESEPLIVTPVPASITAESESEPLIAESMPVVGASTIADEDPAESIPVPEQPAAIPTMPHPADEPTSSRPSVTIPAKNWRPTMPSPLEKALQTLSGWPKLVVPFLMQNIGWFVGGFCFVTGALFLIANTQGYANALVVFASLFGTTVFLLWAGYRFRRKGNDLIVASNVLLTLAMLLAPLDLAVAVRLVSASVGDGLLLAFSVAITVTTLAAYVWSATLANALMDRALPRRYIAVLVGLAGLQLAAPLAVIVPHWPGLALLQLILLALLGYGLWHFANMWLQRLFVDRWLTTYYAAGVLVYTAVVSFVHLNWIWPEPLPEGSAGPALMILCGLLFTMDAAIKEWVHKYTFLSHFSFALYALSVVAVAIAIQSTPTTLLTLALGALLYGWITWRYRTLPPLYLLFGCLAGLYGFGIVTYLPSAWQGLASLPGLAVLLAVGGWASSRSRTIALQCLILFGVVLIGALSWSLWFWERPGIAGFVTTTVAAWLVYRATRLALRLPEADSRWAYAGVAVMALADLAVLYAPRWMPLAWEVENALSLLVLAGLWTGFGLHDRQQSAHNR